MALKKTIFKMTDYKATVHDFRLEVPRAAWLPECGFGAPDSHWC
jgi:hypothetical protein